MPADGGDGDGLDVDEAIRTLLVLMPRVVTELNRTRGAPQPPPSFAPAPRQLSLLAHLFFDGPMGVTELATRLRVVPATASLMVGELSRRGIVTRQEDGADRRRTIVGIAEEHRASVDGWLAVGREAWRRALEPLTPAQRRTFVATLHAFERELGATPRVQ